MNKRELVLKSVQTCRLPDLFTETLGDKHQETITIHGNVSDFDFSTLFKEIPQNDLLCTNNMYKVDRAGYQLWTGEGICLLEIKEDLINRKYTHSDFLESPELFDWLVDLYTQVSMADSVYTLRKAS